MAGNLNGIAELIVFFPICTGSTRVGNFEIFRASQVKGSSGSMACLLTTLR
jgi:hypothetical protein